MESANTLRQAIYDYAAEYYNIQPEYLWHSYPDLVQSLIHDNPGFRPAYHMNKQRWVSILLDGSVDIDNIRTLIDTSYDLTTK